MNQRTALLASIGFLFFYSSGYVAAKVGLAFTTPQIFLFARYGLAAVLFLGLFLIRRPAWPISWKQRGHIVVSGLGYSAFSLFTFAALSYKISPALAALIISLQPILVSLGAVTFLKERVSKLQALGFVLGFLGVGIALYENIGLQHVPVTAILFAVAGLLSLTLSNLYQKRFVEKTSLISIGVLQNFASTLLLAVVCVAIPSPAIHWSYAFIGSVLWITFGLSMLSISLLWLLLRHRDASTVSSLFYLVPAIAALQELAYFGTLISAATLIGMLVTMLGLLLVNNQIEFFKKKFNSKNCPTTRTESY
jgi:drug/metabolite transporter (DMT)-like permease